MMSNAPSYLLVFVALPQEVLSQLRPPFDKSNSMFIKAFRCGFLLHGRLFFIKKYGIVP